MSLLLSADKGRVPKQKCYAVMIWIRCKLVTCSGRKHWIVAVADLALRLGGRGKTGCRTKARLYAGYNWRRIGRFWLACYCSTLGRWKGEHCPYPPLRGLCCTILDAAFWELRIDPSPLL